MRQAYMLGQRGIGGFVTQVVTNVRKKCPLRLQPLDCLQRTLHRGVRGMRLMPQRIQKQNVQALQLAQRGIGDLAVICQIRRRAKALSINLGFAMDHYNGLEPHPKYVYRAVDRSQFKQR